MPRLSRIFSLSAYINRCRQFWYRARYDVQSLRREENEKFNEAGFDRDAAERNLREHLCAMGRQSDGRPSGMGSIHWVLFACIARNPAIKRILEIGTYDGGTTALLARLFPKSQVVTIDLPASDPVLRSTYGRESKENFEQFERVLAENTRAENITSLRINSFFLPAAAAGPFDLIWVDGGHHYPEIAWDLCNAYHLTRDRGVIMCDDVIMHPNGLRDDCVSPDSYKVLRYIADRTGGKLLLFLKREAAQWSANPRHRKFVALLCKTGEKNHAVTSFETP